MKRYDVINELIKKHEYRRYLEIGTQSDECLKRVACDYKVGVDPYPVSHDDKNSDAFYEMTSDEFFEQNAEPFDIVFIDGLHESHAAERDIRNAISRGAKCVVVHDCNPENERCAMPPIIEDGVVSIPHLKTWNGDVWRAFVRLRKDGMWQFTVDTDYGVGVIFPDEKRPPVVVGELSFSEFDVDRKFLLNIISIDEFKSLIHD